MNITEAASASLSTDAAALYVRSETFRDAFDREVLDYLSLRERITLPMTMRALGRLQRSRVVPWSPDALASEIARRSQKVQAARARLAGRES